MRFAPDRCGSHARLSMKPSQQFATLALVGAVLGLFCVCAGPRRVRVSVVQAGKPFDVPISRSAEVEALCLALLENSSYENGAEVANQNNWSHYATQDHVAIAFKRPRNVRVLGKPLAIAELMMPVSKERAPPDIFVRSNGRVRAFCKFACEMSMDLQAELRNGRSQD